MIIQRFDSQLLSMALATGSRVVAPTPDTGIWYYGRQQVSKPQNITSTAPPLECPGLLAMSVESVNCDDTTKGLVRK